MCSWSLSSSVVNMFHFVVSGGGVFISVKQPRKHASNTVIWELQRGAMAEDIGKACLARLHRVLFGYNFHL